jgi:hypothetical protein
MKESQFLNPKLRAIIIAGALIYILPFVALSWYNHPTNDDFWYAKWAQKYGFWNAQKVWIETISERYFSTAVMSLNPLVFNSYAGFRIFPVVLMVLWWFSFFYALRSIAKSAGRPVAVTGAFIWLVVHLATMISVYEGVYSMSATVVYQLGYIALFWLLIMISRYRSENAFRIFCAAALFLVIVAGSSETLSFLSILLLALLSIFSFGEQWLKPKRKILVSMLVIAVLLGLLHLMAPGNIKKANLPKAAFSFDLVHACSYSVLGTGYYFLRFLTNPVVLGVLIFIQPVLNRIIRYKKMTANAVWFGKRYLIFIPVTAFFLCAAILFPYLYIMGSNPEPRISHLLNPVFLVLMVWLSIFIQVRFLLNPAGLQSPFRFQAAGTLLFVAGLFLGNYRLVAGDLLSGKASAYSKERNERYRLIAACTTDTCIVPALRHVPLSLTIGDGTMNEGSEGIHVGEYFHRKWVRVSE